MHIVYAHAGLNDVKPSLYWGATSVLSTVYVDTSFRIYADLGRRRILFNRVMTVFRPVEAEIRQAALSCFWGYEANPCAEMMS